MLCLFEDATVRNFYPVARTRHLSHLLVGSMSLRERAVRLVAAVTHSSEVTLHGRRYIRDYYRAYGEKTERPGEDTLFLNARLPITRQVVDNLPKGEEWIVKKGGEVMVARLRENSVAKLDWEAEALDFGLLGPIPEHELEAGEPYEYLWDLIYDNGERIIRDYEGQEPERDGIVMEGAHLVNPSSITIGTGTTVRSGVVLDASGGAIILGDNVTIMPNSVIEGPCYIGNNSTIKIAAKIYEGSSFGPWCKVGGEVEGSIIQGYSNKQHDGFLGHSYLGRWVNLGADTNTSDLKNNYGTVRVQMEGKEINSGRMFIGSLIGDHSKTGINTMLNTGTMIGVSCNIFGGGFPPKAIPSYSWGGADGFEVFRPDKAMELAKAVMGRRSVEFMEADEVLLRHIFREEQEGAS